MMYDNFSVKGGMEQIKVTPDVMTRGFLNTPKFTYLTEKGILRQIRMGVGMNKCNLSNIFMSE